MNRAPQDRVPLSEIIWLGLFWFAMSFHWGALLTIVIPIEVLRFVPEAQKELYLSFLSAGGAVMAMVVSPIAGALSDRSTLRMGRRRPFVILGVLVDCVALLALRFAPTYAWFVAAFLVVQLALNFAGGAFNGLIPDKIPKNQRGMTSGVMGFMMMGGTITAFLLAGYLVGRGATGVVYWIVAGVLLTCMVLMASQITENPLREVSPVTLRAFARSFWIDPRRHPDFAWLFATRGLVMLGFYSLTAFLLFFIKDSLRLTPPQAGEKTGILAAVVIASGSLVALGAGWASDRVGRRGIVSTSGVFLALTSIGLLFQPPYSVLLWIGVLFGIGYGAFTSVDWALAIDVLPSSSSAAKDLGIWGITNTFTQALAPAIAGPILYTFNRRAPTLGYSVLFSLAIVYVTLGSIFVWKIKGAR